jgi:hypothetical protein
MKKKRISELTTDELIEHLKSKIEKLAPSDPGQKEGREDFYKRLNEIPKDKQRNILIQVFGSQIASDLTHKTEKAQKRQPGIEELEKEEAKEREKARKRNEYIQRCLAKGKIPKVKPPDSMLLVPERPPHFKKGIFLLNLWDLYIALKKAKLSPIYENLRLILQDFLNVFMGKTEADFINSIKRELSRMRNDPAYRKHMREYVESKIRSRKAPKSF